MFVKTRRTKNNYFLIYIIFNARRILNTGIFCVKNKDGKKIYKSIPAEMKTLSILLTLLVATPNFAQQVTDPKEMFDEGQFFFQREDFKEALYFFKLLIQKYPENANYNFKVGECYLNIPGQEYLGVSYLEKASKKTVSKRDYNERSFDESNAPLHALFYLGNAYRADGKLDDALLSYAKFIDSPYFYRNYNLAIVENEVRSTERAKIIQDTPIDFEKFKLEGFFNTSFSEERPIVSRDGNSMVFIRGLKFYDAIFYTVKKDGKWLKPININQDVKSDGDYYPTSLSNDGKKLLFVREKDLNSDVYISYLQDTVWSPAQKIEGKINTMVQETFAAFGETDNVIYLVSDRQGGKGGTDIFKSKRTSKGTWGKPKNLGAVINSELNEETPMVCNEGKTLFFSSQSHYNMGGYDIFYSYFENGKWSIPRNIGYPVNTTQDDLFYMIDETCQSAIHSIIDAKNGEADLFKITVTEPLAVPEQVVGF